MKQSRESEKTEWRRLEDKLKNDVITLSSEVGNQKRKISQLEQLIDEQSNKMDNLRVEQDVSIKP